MVPLKLATEGPSFEDDGCSDNEGNDDVGDATRS